MISDNDISTDLVAYLQQREPFKILIGSAIFPDEVPADQDLPYCVYEHNGTEREHHLSGSSGMAKASMRIEVFSKTRRFGRRVTEAIRLAFDGYTEGAMLEYDVRYVVITNTSAEHIQPTSGDSEGLFNSTVDFEVTFRETVPTFPAS